MVTVVAMAVPGHPPRRRPPWEVLGGLPEMVQTAYGSFTTGLDLKPGQSVLIRGGTCSVGLAAAALATWHGATVLSTTRRADRLALLHEHGVDHPLLDTGEVAPAVRELYPDGVDAALDRVGTPTLPDTLRAVRVHGTACFSGNLSNQWTVRDFSPNEYLPKGVRLAGHFGAAADLTREAFQELLDAVAVARLAADSELGWLAARSDGKQQVANSKIILMVSRSPSSRYSRGIEQRTWLMPAARPSSPPHGHATPHSGESAYAQLRRPRRGRPPPGRYGPDHPDPG